MIDTKSNTGVKNVSLQVYPSPKILVNDLDKHQPLADAFSKPYNLQAGLWLSNLYQNEKGN